jgi:RNA polymerase sigma-70 factor (ECF subfamily)
MANSWKEDKKLDYFLTKYRSKLLLFAVFSLKNEDHALDVLQDTMIGFVKVALDYHEDAWLNLCYKILKRRIIDFQRKQRWRNRLCAIIPFSQLRTEQDLDQSEYKNPTKIDKVQLLFNSVESQYRADCLADEFEHAFKRLPKRQQEAYLLRQWQGMSTIETAEIMACSMSSVKTHLSRAMQSLKVSLGEWIE